MSLEKVVYTAHAKATGGRDGRAISSDNILDVKLAVPKEMGGAGGGTNPEQLFAAGYSQHPDGIRYNTEDATERQELYTIAKNECLDIISKGYNTLGTFEANFKALCAEGTIAGAESIFEIPFSKTGPPEKFWEETSELLKRILILSLRTVSFVV